MCLKGIIYLTTSQFQVVICTSLACKQHMGYKTQILLFPIILNKGPSIEKVSKMKAKHALQDSGREFQNNHHLVPTFCLPWKELQASHCECLARVSKTTIILVYPLFFLGFMPFLRTTCYHMAVKQISD